MTPILSDGVLTDTLIRTHYITASPPPVGDFTAAPLMAPLGVTFTDQSSGAGDSYLWGYGDGITGTTSALTHTHVYTRAGVYTVTLTASGLGGSETLTRTNYITVSAGIGYTTTTRSLPTPTSAQPP